MLGSSPWCRGCGHRAQVPARAHLGVELGDDPSRYLTARRGRLGDLLELVVLDVEVGELVMYAMALRGSTQRALVGGTDR